MYSNEVVNHLGYVQMLQWEVQEVRSDKKWLPNLTWLTHIQTLHFDP